MKKKVQSFEQKFKKAMGKRYKKISKKDREVIKEMSKCQQEGGAIGSATTILVSPKK